MRCLVRTFATPALLLLALSAGFLVPTAASASHSAQTTERSWSPWSRVWDEGGTRAPRVRVARATTSDAYDDEEVRPRYRSEDAQQRSRYAQRKHNRLAKHQVRRRSAARHRGASRRAAHHGRPARRAAAPAWTKRSLSTAGPRGSGQFGVASYYWQPQRVASGGWFNPAAMTAAHRTLPFGTRVRVTHVASGRSVEVKINDRGPYIAGRIIDLSKAAAGVIGMTQQGIARVAVEVLGR
jgi:peptidoglycan lytic transglycosylase